MSTTTVHYLLYIILSEFPVFIVPPTYLAAELGIIHLCVFLGSVVDLKLIKTIFAKTALFSRVVNVLHRYEVRSITIHTQYNDYSCLIPL